MNNEQVLIINRSKIIVFTQFSALLGIAIIAPLFHQQMVTGPIVNATLFVSAIILGREMGIFIGLIPSVIALSVGTLPPALAPMVPYIMMSNAVLILTFYFFKDVNYWLAVAVASFFKFLFLFATSSIVVGLLLNKHLADSVSMMMSYPQLLTALAGGILAKIFLFFFQKTRK